MKRTEGVSWQYPKRREDSIQNLLDGLHLVEWEFRKNRYARGVSKEYLEHIKYLIETAIQSKDGKSSYARTEQVKTSVRQQRARNQATEGDAPWL